MRPEIVNQLLHLNWQFYQTFALQFAESRQRLQPGVYQIIDKYISNLPPGAAILDLGCGNGELARVLHQQQLDNGYVGLDFSVKLLDRAGAGKVFVEEQANPGFSRSSGPYFLERNFATPGWEVGLPISTFDCCLAFAMFHHLPGEALRQAVLHSISPILKPGGLFIHSEWQFLNSARLSARILPWELIGLTKQDVDEGDYLLDWRSGGIGLRYVHYFGEAELAHLATTTSFQIVDTFYSDGEGGKLGLYQVWENV